MKNNIKRAFKVISFSLIMCSCTQLQEIFIGEAITAAKTECSKSFTEPSFEKACKKGIKNLSTYVRKLKDKERAIKMAKEFCDTQYQEKEQKDKDDFNHEEACIEGVTYLQEFGEVHAHLYNKTIGDHNRNSSPINHEESSGEEAITKNKQVIEV